MLSIHLRLFLPSGLFPLAFLPITYTRSSSPPIRATCPAHLILLDFIILWCPISVVTTLIHADFYHSLGLHLLGNRTLNCQCEHEHVVIHKIVINLQAATARCILQFVSSNRL
jgi:hypothetical protein